jgi:toxin-antitoxin system PIN domain toxin
MIVPDVNMLVYAHNGAAREHHDARRWWETLLNGTEAVGLPWVVSAGFVRVISNPKVLCPPLARESAVDYVAGWLAFSHVNPLNPGSGHMSLFRQNAAVSGGDHNLATDAHIAALAMEYGAEVHSADSDFGRFPGVRWHNPLA